VSQIRNSFSKIIYKNLYLYSYISIVYKVVGKIVSGVFVKRIVDCLKSARSAEVTMMLGFPATGLLFSFSQLSHLFSMKTLMFMAAIFFLSSAIYSFNALSGIKEDEKNERLKNDLGSSKMFFFKISLTIFIVLFVLLFYIIDLTLLILSIISFFLWFLYSFPRTGLKYKPVAGTIIHFAGQIIHFHMGYIILSGFSLNSFLISIYFAILFSSGHLNHELIDYEADKTMEINSGAVFFGKKRWEEVSGYLFLSSTLYIIFLIMSGIVVTLEGIPFAFAGIIHFIYRILYLKNDLTKMRFLKERKFYRIIYFIAGILFIIVKVATP